MAEYLSLSDSVQGLIRVGFALCTLGMLGLSLPNGHRFFGTASRQGYLDDSRVLTRLLSPWGRVLVLSSWIAGAVGNCSPVGVLSAGGCPGLDVRRGES